MNTTTAAERRLSTETPGPYGWNATREQRETVEQEITRQREQRARRRAETREQVAR